MSPDHRLDPLLRPQTIALLGASDRPGSPGNVLARMVIDSAYSGEVYPVNPAYPEILGKPCYPDLAALPETVEHVVIALGNPGLERALQAAIDHGARAATVYSSGVLDEDIDPRLLVRLESMARNAGLLVCGVNGMGFYNPGIDLHAGIFPRDREIPRGGISYIAQSGSAFAALCHNGCRLGFNLCVSTGNEMVTGVADYMDWSLEQADTRVIGMFLETVRDPAGFVAVLEKANRRQIPVVILKVGRTARAAAMAKTHTGAIAGNQAAFEALCRRHGVIEVGDFDEMAATLMLLQTDRETGAGSFAAVFESGGLREMITDLAETFGVEFAPLGEPTLNGLRQHLEAGLKAENPLDAWGTHADFEQRFEACLDLLMRDPNVAAGAFVSNFRDGYFLSEAIYRVVEKVAASTGKPLLLANCYSDLASADICRRGREAGIPVIDGARESLLAIRHLFAWRDFRRRLQQARPAVAPASDSLAACESMLARCSSGPLQEHEALAILAAFSIPVVEHELVENEQHLTAAAARLGFPLVLKTAEPGIAHKSDVGGVRVDLRCEEELGQAYADLRARLGPKALLCRMLRGGVELALGTIDDPQFGPLVMLAAGGTLVELLADRALALCPVDAATAEEMLASLRVAPLLDGLRGAPAANRAALIEAVVRLSQFAYLFRERVAEIDVNPLIVDRQGATAVDALIVTR
jgi:acyl-CoA synthetase (NDP forming)